MMFGLPNPYVLLGGAAAALALVGGAWVAYEHHGTTEYKRGTAEVTAQWKESDRVAVAVGNETTALLKRGAVANEGRLNAQLANQTARNAVGAVALAQRGATVDGLRNALLAASTAQAGSAQPGPACRSNEADLGRCRAVLSASLAVAAGADTVVDAGQRLVGNLAAKVTALQGHAGLVQSSHADAVTKPVVK